MSNIHDLIHQLTNPATKKLAISALIDLGSTAECELINEMQTCDVAETRLRLAFILGKIGCKNAADAIFDVARDLPDYHGFEAIQALRRISAVDKLINLFGISSDSCREKIIAQLMLLRDVKLIPTFMQGLKDPNERVREIAFSALDQLDYFNNFSDLEPFINDPSSSIWSQAIKIGFRVAYPDTMKWLSDGLINGNSDTRMSLLSWLRYRMSTPAFMDPVFLCLVDKDPKVRVFSILYLNRLNHPDILNILLRSLNDEDWEVRQYASRCLARRANPGALKSLSDLINDPNNNVRTSIAEAIGKIKEPSSIHIIQQQLNKENDEVVREYLIAALVDIGTEQSINIVLESPLIFSRHGYTIEKKLAKDWPEKVLEKAQDISKSKSSKSRSTLTRTLGLIGDPSTFKILLNLLYDPDPEVFREAAKALAMMGTPEANEVIRQLLERQISHWVRIEIYRAFASRKDASLLDKMIASLEDDNEWLHGQAIESLCVLSEPAAIDPLIRLMFDPSKKRRSMAAEALGRMQAKEAIPALILALHEGSCEDDNLALHSAWALGKLHSSQAIPALVQALHIARNNDNYMLIGTISEALGKMAAADAVEELVSEISSDPVSVQGKAIRALGKIQDPRAIPSLTSTLYGPDQSIRPVVIRALGQIGGETAVSTLVNILRYENDPDYMIALKALARCAYPDAIPLLIELFKHPSPNISKLAGKALARTGEQSFQDLLSLLPASSPLRRRQIAWILGEIGSPKSIEVLAQLLNDPDWRVRYKTVQALGKIKSSESLKILKKAITESHLSGADTRKSNNFKSNRMTHRCLPSWTLSCISWSILSLFEAPYPLSFSHHPRPKGICLPELTGRTENFPYFR